MDLPVNLRPLRDQYLTVTEQAIRDGYSDAEINEVLANVGGWTVKSERQEPQPQEPRIGHWSDAEWAKVFADLARFSIRDLTTG